jgi:hypothetical protein
MGYAPAAIISITLMFIHLFCFDRFRTGRQDAEIFDWGQWDAEELSNCAAT